MAAGQPGDKAWCIRQNLHDEGIGTAGKGRLKRSDDREVGRRGLAYDIGVAGRVHGDAVAEIIGSAAQISGVEEGGGVGV